MHVDELVVYRLGVVSDGGTDRGPERGGGVEEFSTASATAMLHLQCRWVQSASGGTVLSCAGTDVGDVVLDVVGKGMGGETTFVVAKHSGGNARFGGGGGSQRKRTRG